MKKILLGITGSVAAIKTKLLISQLSEQAEVRLILTQHSEYFIQHDLDFLKSKNIAIFYDQDEWPSLDKPYEVGQPILHIELRRWADVLLIAPLDANTLAKVTYGFCDNLLTSVVRAWDWKKPLILCPAMNTVMWENPPTDEQIHLLQQRGAQIVAPVVKKLACQDTGMSGMAEVDDIIRAISLIL